MPKLSSDILACRSIIIFSEIMLNAKSKNSIIEILSATQGKCAP
jgi:hypothetical protein